MKKAVMLALVSLVSASLISAADFDRSKRSSDLTKNPAINGRVLYTDGTYNYWALLDGGTLTNIPASIVQAGTFPAGNFIFQNDATIQGLTASLPVFTDGNKKLISGTIGSAVTGVANTVATVLSGLGSPTTAAAITGFGAHTTANAVTDYGSPQTADVITTLGTPTTANAVTAYGSPLVTDVCVGYVSPTEITVVTNYVLELSGTLYDSTGTALTNALGAEVSAVTNVIAQTGTAIAALGSAITASVITNLGTATTAAAITGFGSHTTAAAITNLGAATTAAAITALGTPTTANAVTAYGSPTTDSVVDSITPTTATFAKP